MDSSSGQGVQIPIERELQERLAWFIRLRWVAAAGILLGALAGSWYVRSAELLIPVYLLSFAVLGYNFLFYRYFRRVERRNRLLGLNFIYLQIAVDWLALVCVAHFTGGIRSPVVLAFALHVVIGAILLSRRSCYLLAACAASLTGIVAALEGAGIWPLSEGGRVMADPVHGIASPLSLWIADIVFFAVIAYLATSITRRLREKEVVLFESEQELDRAYRQTEALYRIGQVINSTLEMNEVLSLIAENAARLMGMMACSIRLLDPEGDKLYVSGSYGLSPSFVSKGPVDLSGSPLDRETLERGVVHVIDVVNDQRFQFREDARREGIHSALCLSMTAKSRALGVIRIYSAVPHEFTPSEQALLLNLANLGALAIENARSYAELKGQSEQRVWFARVTHHQLRAPLGAIQSVLDAVTYAGPLTDKQKELLARASRRVQDTFDLIRDLLDLAAAQRPLENGTVEFVHVNKVLQKIFETARERAQDKGVEFRTTIAGGEIVLQAQAADVERIFSNLLDNAIKYTPSGGSVRFDLAYDDGTVRATVSDSGIGIDTNDQARIFDGFYRTQAAKNSGEMGTGLGLSIVKRLLDRYGGKLELESALGQGSRFIVTLPRRIDSIQQKAHL